MRSYLIVSALMLCACSSNGGNATSNGDGGLGDGGVDGEVDSGGETSLVDTGFPVLSLEGGFDLNQTVESDPISYNGGPVQTSPSDIYFILYGNWQNSTTPQFLETLVNNLSDSPILSTTSNYYQYVLNSNVGDGGDAGDASGDAGFTVARQYVSASVSFGGSTTNNYSNGKLLMDADVSQIVSNAITSKALPLDVNGIYFILTSPDVSVSSGDVGSCDWWCAYHSFMTVNNTSIRNGVIIDPSNCLDTCSVQSVYEYYGYFHSPNNSWAADSMASVLLHEIAEANTDPMLNAWIDDLNEENGDKCAYLYGNLFTTENGSIANVKLANGSNYLLQELWSIDTNGNGACKLY